MSIRQVWNNVEDAFGITDELLPYDLESYLDVKEALSLSSKLLELLEKARNEAVAAADKADEEEEKG